MKQHQGKRMFVTGASGYIGSVLTEFAITEGYEVHGLTRSDTGEEKLRQLGAIPVRGDLTSLAVIRQESALADVVVSLASAFNVQCASYDEVIDIDNAALDAMADGLEGTNKPLVTTAGSLFAAPDPKGGETNEDAPNNLHGANTRYKNEDHALSLTDRGICVTSMRLAPYVYGRAASGVALFMKMSAGAGSATIIDGGNKPTTYVHVDDAARLYLLSAEKGRPGEKYNTTGGNDVTFREVHTAIAEAINVPVNDQAFEEVREKFGFLALFLSAANKASNAKARRELGWEPKEIGIIEDIKTGSYVELAQSFKKG